jgi:hypothetical protein
VIRVKIHTISEVHTGDQSSRISQGEINDRPIPDREASDRISPLRRPGHLTRSVDSIQNGQGHIPDVLSQMQSSTLRLVATEGSGGIQPILVLQVEITHHQERQGRPE